MSKNMKNNEVDAQAIKLRKRQEDLYQQAEKWISPVMPEVLRQLEWFKDQKLGLMVHWGLYNQLGMKESWPLVDDLDWTKWQFPDKLSNKEVKEIYMQLHKGMLPLRFDPEEWAEIASNAGFRYLTLTTKHHDGFCMWDTKTTDYKITGSACPFHNHKHADVVKALYNAFRAKDMGIFVYFSRADFACPYYWEEGYLMQDGTRRVPSYDPALKPDTWKKFQAYVRDQLLELATEYGKIDCLWFDGGCDGYTLGLPDITAEIRKIQPWVMSVIRNGGGECEDFLTPELFVPDEALKVPWETCTTMGKPYEENGHRKYVSFGYSFDQEYMKPIEMVHLLVDIIAKGGNLALNIAPQPDGPVPRNAILALEAFGAWMKVFGDAVYGTRAVAPYRTGKFAFTQKGERCFAFYLYDENETAAASYVVPYTGNAHQVRYLRTGQDLAFTQNGNSLVVTMPRGLHGAAGLMADVFEIRSSQ